MWYWWVFRLENCKCRKKLLDKLAEECTENVEEIKLAKVTLAKNENKHKCSSCTLYIVLYSILFTVNIGIGAYFVHYKYMNSDKEIGATEFYATIIRQNSNQTYRWGKSMK